MKNKIVLTVLIIFQIMIIGKITAGDKNKIVKSAEDICPIKIGEEVPSAIIRTAEGEEVDIRDVVMNKKTILIFYRGGWCPYCNLHLSELQNIEDDLVKLGYKIIAISMDKPEILSATIDKHSLNYELYSDSKAEACKAFGIAFRVSDDYVNKLKEFNMDLEASSGENNHILPVPSVFLIEDSGKIKFEYVNPNYKERISGKLLLETAKMY